MIVKRHVLYAKVKNMVCGKIYSTHIVKKNNRLRRSRDSQFRQKIRHPKHFSGSVSYRPVLSFSWRTSNSLLLLWGPDHMMRAKINNVRSCWSIIIPISRPVGLREGMKVESVVVAKKDALIASSRKIAKNTFCCLPLFIRRTMHKLWQLVHSKSHIWSGKMKILHASTSVQYSRPSVRGVPEVSCKWQLEAIGVESGLASRILVWANKSVMYFFVEWEGSPQQCDVLQFSENNWESLSP